MDNKDDLIEALKEANVERQKIIDRLAFETCDKSQEIRELKELISRLERCTFRALERKIN